ncbi:MAG TPA: DUF368 domain-containing protein [Clostridiaceae bacterium]|nr:DUF368 domain-containing protein [Clostridiaceae bacterium]
MNILNIIWDFIKGLIIGIGGVAPGVSGGTFAVMLGVYEKITYAIANIFKDFKNIKETIITFLPLALGMGAGFLAFGNIMKYLFEHYEIQVKLLFIGLMLGSLPFVLKEANKQGFKKYYIFPCIITLGLTVLFLILEKRYVNIVPKGSTGIIVLLIYGAIIGFGTIVPGASSAFILMYFGAYEVLLDGLVNMDLMILIPVGLGCGLSILLFAKIISYLFKKFHGITYYTVLGFVLGSIITIFPEINFNIGYLIGIILGVLGFIGSYKLSQIGEKLEAAKKIV